MSKDFKPRTGGRTKAGSPLLTGILIGIVIGLGTAILVAWYVPSLTRGFRQPETVPATPQPTKPAAPTSQPQAEKKPRFDFYNILPGTEEPVKEDTKPPTVGDKEKLFLQAGAFQKQEEADNLKARLALMGVEATVQSAEVPEKGVVHRVRIGPFTSVDELSRVRATLAENGIQASLIKVRGNP